jgi:hypothetical protein
MPRRAEESELDHHEIRRPLQQGSRELAFALPRAVQLGLVIAGEEPGLLVVVRRREGRECAFEEPARGIGIGRIDLRSGGAGCAPVGGLSGNAGGADRRVVCQLGESVAGPA